MTKYLAIALVVVAAGQLSPAWAIGESSQQSGSPQSSSMTEPQTGAASGQSATGNQNWQNATGATGQSRAAASLSDKEQEFVKEVVQNNMAEIDLANLGVSKATNPQVKQFAQTMKDTHTQWNQRLMQLAAGKVSADEKASHHLQKEIDRLQKVSGDEFDRDFMKQVTEQHRKTISRFEEFQNKAKSPELKSWIQSNLPTLRTHLQTAQSISGRKGEGVAREGQQQPGREYSPTGKYDVSPGTSGRSTPGSSNPSGTSATPGAGSSSPSGSSSSPGASSPGSAGSSSPDTGSQSNP